MLSIPFGIYMCISMCAQYVTYREGSERYKHTSCCLGGRCRGRREQHCEEDRHSSSVLALSGLHY